MVELYAAFTVLSMDNGTRDAIIITLTGILANFFWHIVKHSWRACFGHSGRESEVTEQKPKHNEPRYISFETIGKERDGAREERDEAREERDEALKDRDKYWEERDDYWKQRNEALGERDTARKQRDDARRQRDRAYEERDKLRKAKLESDENDKLSLLVLERHQCL